jgi:hypothetical protein
MMSYPVQTFLTFIDPLGYDEAQRELFPRDDLIQLAGDDCKDLILSQDLP